MRRITLQFLFLVTVVLSFLNLCVGQYPLYANKTCGFEVNHKTYNLVSLQYSPYDTILPSGYSFSNAVTGDTISINFCAQVAPSIGCTNTTSTNPPVEAPGSCQTITSVTPPFQVIGNAQIATFSVLPPGFSGNFRFYFLFFK